MSTTVPTAAGPRRELTLYDSTCIIVGIIIGAAIYRSSPVIAGLSPSVTVLLGLWLLGGVLSLLGALCYAELATAYPHEGGDYVYLDPRLGRPVGFLFAWCQLWIVRPGSIGAMAYAFADYRQPHLAAGTDRESAGPVLVAYAAGSIVVLSGVNILGVREGKWTQNVLTTAKVLGLAAIVVIGLVYAAPQVSPLPLGEGQGVTAVPAVSSRHDFSLANLGLAMIFVLFAYGGWNEMAYVAAEVKEPRKNILRACWSARWRSPRCTSW